MNKYFKKYDEHSNNLILEVLISKNNEYIIIENHLYHNNIYVGDIEYTFNKESKKIELLNEDFSLTDAWDKTADIASGAIEFTANMFKFPSLTGDMWQDTINWGHYLFSMGSIGIIAASLIFTGGAGASASKLIDILDLGLSGFETYYLYTKNNMMEAGISAFVFIVGGAMMAIPGSSAIAKSINSAVRKVAKGLWDVSGGLLWKFIKLLCEKLPQYGKLFIKGIKEIPNILTKCKELLSKGIKYLISKTCKIPSSISSKLKTLLEFFSKKLDDIGNFFKTKIVPDTADITNISSLNVLDKIDNKLLNNLSKKDTEFLKKITSQLDNIIEDKEYLSKILSDNDTIKKILRKQSYIIDEKSMKNFSKVIKTEKIRNSVLELSDDKFKTIMNKINNDGEFIKIIDDFSSDNIKSAINILTNKNNTVSIHNIKKVIDMGDQEAIKALEKNRGDVFKSILNVKNNSTKQTLFKSIDNNCNIAITKNKIRKYRFNELETYAKNIGLGNENGGVMLYKGKVIKTLDELKSEYKDDLLLSNMTLVRNAPYFFNNIINYISPDENNSSEDIDSLMIIENPETPISDESIKEMNFETTEMSSGTVGDLRTDEQKQAIVNFCKKLNSDWKLVNDNVFNAFKNSVDKNGDKLSTDKEDYKYEKYSDLKPFIKLLQSYLNKYLKLEEKLVVDGVIGKKTLNACIEYFTKNQNKPNIVEDVKKLIEVLRKK